MTFHLNIGSNLGDRRQWLDRAVQALRTTFPGAPISVSDIIETPAWGYESDHPYLNIGMTLELPSGTDIADTFARIRATEATLSTHPHRDCAGGYADRPVDIDLIAADDITTDTPVLTLPHPRMHLREFVLRPMAQLAPEWVHPHLGLTAEQMLLNL